MRTWRGGGKLRRSIRRRSGSLPAIMVPAVREGVNPAWHLYPIRLNLEMLTAGRGEIFRALRAENIGVNVHYIPVHQHPYYRERFKSSQAESYPVAEDAYERLISLPMFHSMTAQDVEDVIHAVRKVLSITVVSRWSLVVRERRWLANDWRLSTNDCS